MMNVSLEVQDILNAAYQEARVKNHEYITPEHILYAALHFSYPRRLVRECGGNPDEIREDILKHLSEKVPVVKGGFPDQSVLFQSVITRAAMHSENASRESIEIGDIILSLFDEEKSFCSYYMKKAGITRLSILEVLSHVLGRSEKDMKEKHGIDPEEEGAQNADKREEPVGGDPEGEEQRTKESRNPLDLYARDLVELAKANQLDPLVGRKEELERTMQILCRKRKNNPLHLGEPGVGKTAITEGLAQRLANDEVPDLLKGFKLYALDMGAMLAGTRYRGDFEERIKQVLKAIEKLDKAILFIDEIHTLVGAGATSGGSMDASNLLKPALASGKLRVIGATTPEEYRKFMEKDRALARRFQQIEVNAPSNDEAIQIVSGLASAYENFHQVRYSDEVIRAVINLSTEYINDRQLPDKAIDVLDECGALMHMKTYKTPEVETKKADEKAKKSKKHEESEEAAPAIDKSQWPEITIELVEQVVSRMARVPVKTATKTDKERLAHLESDLLSAVYGQDPAVKEVITAVKRSRAGFRKPNKPVANFLFVGPTGVGKTELARTLANALNIELIRFDMSEYQEEYTISRLIGSSPGYVGYEDGGQLTEAIRRHPHAVLLLDEIEKAHPRIYNVLLQVLDYATLTDNQGRKADFRNVIIIMTSNAGARDLGKSMIGFGGAVRNEGAMDEAVERIFSPEFRNRLDKVVKFNGLDSVIVENIVRKELREFEAQLSLKNVGISYDDDVVTFLAQKGYSASFGARNLARIVDDLVRTKFIDEVLFGSLSEGGKARLVLKDDLVDLVIEKKE